MAADGLPEPDSPVPTSGSLPDGVLRDDCDTPTLPPGRLFRADRGVFRHTLVRLPAVRTPWLRELLDGFPQHTRAGPF